jgi:hypothetical protein
MKFQTNAIANLSADITGSPNHETGCIHAPQTLARGVLRGLPQQEHGGPYKEATWW